MKTEWKYGDYTENFKTNKQMISMGREERLGKKLYTQKFYRKIKKLGKYVQT